MDSIDTYSHDIYTQCHETAIYRPKKKRIHSLPESVLRQDLLLLDTSRRFPLHRRTEEQARSLHRLEQMAQIPAMSRVTVILNIASLGRIRQTIPEPHFLHDVRLGEIPLRGGSTSISLVQALVAALRRPRHRHKRVHFPPHDAHDSRPGVEAGCHGPATGLDRSDGAGGGARDDDVDGLFEGVFLAIAAAA